jgi:hypothetical protein
LLLYGAVAACVGGLVFTAGPGQTPQLQSARVEVIRGSIQVLDHGGPPLLRSSGGAATAAETGDDPGIILYLSLLGHAIGRSDPLQLLRWFFLGAFASLLLVYPLLWFELLSSIAAALISPVLVILQFRFMAIHDIYWVPAWGVLLCIPLLVLVRQRWSRASLALMCGIVLIASLVSSIRAQAGLPILLASIIVVVLTTQPWSKRIAFTLTLVVAYTAISGAAMGAIRHYRDEAVGQNLTNEYTSSHTFWHPAYLGLGYLPNDAGIKWKDQIGLDAVRRVNPRIRYLSPAYERAIRHLYFDFVSHHPWFAVRVYFAKATVVAADAFARFWLLCLLMPAMLLIPTALRAEMRLFALLFVPAAFLGVAPALLGVPTPAYEYPWLAVWGLAWILGLLWLTALIPWQRVATRILHAGSGAVESIQNKQPLSLQAISTPLVSLRPVVAFLRQKGAVRWTLLLFTCIGIAAIATGRVASSIRSESASQFFTSNALAPVPVPHGQLIRRWALEQDRSRWTVLRGVRINEHPSFLDVTTNHERFGYQILSPAFRLHPGAYALIVDGSVRNGGLALGVLDAASHRFVVQDVYSADQQRLRTNFNNGRMLLKFSLASTARVQLVLANWSPQGQTSSAWRLGRIGVFRQKRPCGCSPPQDDAWISRASSQ